MDDKDRRMFEESLLFERVK